MSVYKTQDGYFFRDKVKELLNFYYNTELNQHKEIKEFDVYNLIAHKKNENTLTMEELTDLTILANGINILNQWFGSFDSWAFSINN